MTVTIYIRNKKPEIASYNQKLYVTGRGLCCCDDRRRRLPKGDFVVHETPLTAITHVKTRIGGDARITVADANLVRADVSRQLRQSVNDSHRYPFGILRFTESQIVTDAVARLVRSPAHPDNQPLAELNDLPDAIRARIAQVAPDVSRGRLLSMTVDEQARRFGLDLDDVVTLRRAVLGLAGPDPDPGQAYGREHIVPPLSGQAIEQAKRRIAGAALRIGHVATIDSIRQADTVISQYPRAGTRMDAHGTIDLVLASGAGVVLPDVTGASLADARDALARAGLESEPTVIERPAVEGDHVLAMTPSGGGAVTPHADVVLEVASGEPDDGSGDEPDEGSGDSAPDREDG
jgi:hypothetical protein